MVKYHNQLSCFWRPLHTLLGSLEKRSSPSLSGEQGDASICLGAALKSAIFEMFCRRWQGWAWSCAAALRKPNIHAKWLRISSLSFRSVLADLRLGCSRSNLPDALYSALLVPLNIVSAAIHQRSS